jgi:hypothetical protein
VVDLQHSGGSLCFWFNRGFLLSLCICEKDYARTRSGCFQALLHVVCDLSNVVGLRLLGLSAALWTNNMILSFYFWLAENEPSTVRRSLLSFRWCCKKFMRRCSVGLWMVVPHIEVRGTTAPLLHWTLVHELDGAMLVFILKWCPALWGGDMVLKFCSCDCRTKKASPPPLTVWSVEVNLRWSSSFSCSQLDEGVLVLPT